MNKDLDKAIRSLRPGDTLKVDRLAELATTLRELRTIIKMVHDRGAQIYERTTLRESKGEGAIEMALDAAAEVRKGPPAPVSRVNGARGGRPAKVRETPDDLAKSRWKDIVTYKRDQDAIVDMPGWTISAAWRAFGRSGRAFRGRRPANEDTN